MLKEHLLIKRVCAAFFVALPGLIFAQSSSNTSNVELARHEEEYSSVRFEPARTDQQSGLAVIFSGTHDLHYYARAETAPAPQFRLKVSAKSNDLEFSDAVFPKWEIFNDPVGNKVEVYAGDFTVFIPIKTVKTATEPTVVDVEVTISGMMCTSIACLPPFEKILQTQIDYRRRESWKQLDIEAQSVIETTAQEIDAPGYSTWFALLLAFISGLGLNLMPCVWPVLPLVIMRIVEQAQSGRRQSILMGLVFCIGILLFFATLAGANIILQSFYDRSLSWGDHLRNPAIVTALSLLMIVMALFMFGIFTITIPGSITSKSGSGKGYAGSVGMGFLAAILSTPCSFGILTVAFVWAQGQSLFLGTLAIMVIGLGMATPYAILTSTPGWLKRLPRGGRWMELFKQSLGFVLLIIAVKLVKAVPDENKINLLYFAVILSFCVWVWAAWVPYGTKFSRKWLVRGIVVLLAVSSFWFFFKPELVDWQDYDPAVIASAKAKQQPVLIKFTADWCTNCEIVDKFVYKRKDIAKLIEQKGVLAIKGDTTKASQPATLDLQNVYNEPGVPVTILLLPGKDEPVRLHELFFEKKLKELLEPLPDKK
ncbi:MAG: thioredoxin family protein [Sedimentisphaerales bacterium]|nr:thioredoxin family protein [Sedimentisphaerales bacterium]